MAWVKISPDAIDSNVVEGKLDRDGCGATVCFTGTVRNRSRGRRVHHLDYETYLPLATTELNRVVLEAESRFDVRAAVQHRIGKLLPGQVSLYVAVASPHRSAAFESCYWIMEAVKTSVPVWKRESHDDGVDWIEGNDSVPAVGNRPIP